MDPNRPQLEVLSKGASAPSYPHYKPYSPWYRSARLLIFLIVFLISATISLLYVYSRPAVYQSRAVLLTVAAAKIDERSSEADIEHVAIQRQILTGEEILATTLGYMQENAVVQLGDELHMTLPDMRQMLMVNEVTDTNLVELVAEGHNPELLPFMINTWIDVYLKKRAEEIEMLSDNTSGELQQELTILKSQIDQKSRELDEFRRDNQISSIQRDENRALAQLKGLNASLNKANEEEIKALANLNAIKLSISRGKVVVPKEDASTLSGLQKNADSLKARLDELNQRYTEEYLALNPTLKEIPKQLSEVEEEIKILSAHGQKIVLDDAEREYEAARQTKLAIELQLDNHKSMVSEFTTKFSEHEKLKVDLEGLEVLFRETQQRLAKIESKQQKKYPQLSVVDRAFLPRDPIRPNYVLDAIIAVSGSVLLALFSVWVYAFLTKKETDNGGITLSSVHMYEQKSVAAVADQMPQAQSLPQQTTNALAAPESTEISVDDLQKLFSLSNLKAQQIIALLLNGLKLAEITGINKEDFDFEQKSLFVSGESQRVVPINASVIALFQDSEPCPAWEGSQASTPDDLETILMCAIVDSGISHPEQVNSECLRHTYLIYLVRQGLKLSDLDQIAGYLPPAKLANYRSFSPPSRGLSLKEIDLNHPALA